MVSGVGTSGLPQGQGRVAVVWVPGPSGAHLLTRRENVLENSGGRGRGRRRSRVPGWRSGGGSCAAELGGGPGPPASPPRPPRRDGERRQQTRAVASEARASGREGAPSGEGSGHRPHSLRAVGESTSSSPPRTLPCGLS